MQEAHPSQSTKSAGLLRDSRKMLYQKKNFLTSKVGIWLRKGVLLGLIASIFYGLMALIVPPIGLMIIPFPILFFLLIKWFPGSDFGYISTAAGVAFLFWTTFGGYVWMRTASLTTRKEKTIIIAMIIFLYGAIIASNLIFVGQMAAGFR